jgi:hypothetical protein
LDGRDLIMDQCGCTRAHVAIDNLDRMSAPDFVVRLYDDPAQVDAQAWNDLLGVQQLPTPFMRHEYLRRCLR